LLRELGVKTLILTGIATDVCILHTAADAFFRGYEVLVPEKCTESFTEEGLKMGLDYMKRVYGARVVKLEELLRTLAKRKSG
jgi:nicotinamidase-related amidase